MSRQRLFLLDAYALIYRGYFPFANRPRLTTKGENTSAVIGFLNTFEDILRRAEGGYIAVVFDPQGGTFRHEMYPEYKAQREKQPEAIGFGLPYIKAIIKAMGVRMYEVAHYEADDVIGTIAHKAAAEHPNLEVFMITPDKDYGQLVTDRIHILRPEKGGNYEDYGPAEVAAKHNLLSHNQVIDFLALMGDASDNVPGIPGVGEKTAAQLLREFGSIEGIYDRIDNLTKKALRTNLTENKDRLRQSRTLVRIITDVPMSFTLEDMKPSPPNTQELLEIYEQLEFKSRIDRLLKDSSTTDGQKGTVPERHSLFEGQQDLFTRSENEEVDPSNGETKRSLDTINTIPHRYHCLWEEEDIITLAKRLEKAQAFAFDTETNGLNAMEDQIVGISFAIEPHEAWYIPVSPLMPEAMAQLAHFKKVFADEQILKVGQNIKFDLKFIRRYGIELHGPYWDTMIAHYLLSPELRHGMDFMAQTYLNYAPIPITSLIGDKGKKQKNMSELSPEEIAPYAAEDADITLQLYHYLRPLIDGDESHKKLFYDIEMPLMSVLMSMEVEGVRLDAAMLRETLTDLKKKLRQIEQMIIESVDGYTFNVNSPREVGILLFEQLALVDRPKKTKTGQYSTNEEELEKLLDKHPVIGLILKYRGLKKLISTYIEPLPGLINPMTGRIHTHYNQTVTSTGRLSSNDPNLQNIPVRDDEGKEVRRAFTAHHPNSGDIFVSADYSQVELRLMAHLSQDDALLEAFRSGMDVHAITASHIFRVPVEKVTSEQRRRAKTANFGIIYGISSFGLSSRLSISRKEASELIQGYFASFPKVKEYMSNIIKQAQDMGYVETILGRRSYLPDILSRNSVVRGYAERFAINAPIQGSAADIIKLAMINIARRLRAENYESRMILQVHDELCFSVVPEEKDRLMSMVREEMEGVYPDIRVPLTVDVGVGENWLEAH